MKNSTKTTAHEYPSLDESSYAFSKTAGVMGELCELRSESGKHFRMTDGTVSAVMYDDAVHYAEDGTWLDIDNTLVKTESGKEFTNTACDMAVFFAAQMDDESGNRQPHIHG